MGKWLVVQVRYCTLYATHIELLSKALRSLSAIDSDCIICNNRF